MLVDTTIHASVNEQTLQSTGKTVMFNQTEFSARIILVFIQYAIYLYVYEVYVYSIKEKYTIFQWQRRIGKTLLTVRWPFRSLSQLSKKEMYLHTIPL